MTDKKLEIQANGVGEIRSQEKTRGGLSYEVILAESSTNFIAPKCSQLPSKRMSLEVIQKKLRAAEERRNFFEQKRVANIACKLARTEGASRKKDKMANDLIAQTKERAAK